MTRSTRAKKKSGRRRWLPIMGLTLAVLLAIVSYVVAFPLVEFGRDQNPKIDNAVRDLRETFDGYSWYAENAQYHGNNIAEFIVAAVLWFVLMGLSMFVASLATYGTDPEREAWEKLGPSPANKKAVIKQLKKDLKEAKKRERQYKKKK